MASSIGTLAIRLLVQAQEMQSGFQHAQRQLQQFANQTSHLVSQIQGVLAAVGVSFGVFKAFEAFKEHRDAVRSLNLTLTATGGAAGFAGDELQAMAKKLQDTTSVSKTEILGGMQALAMSGKVSGDVFERATKLAVDLGARTGSVAGAFETVSHALSDPERGIRALHAAGVFLSESQKENVKRMHEMGNAAGAQKIILDQLQASVGGFAEGSNTGMKQMKVAFTELLETVGERLAPAFETLAGWVAIAAKFLREHGDVIFTIAKYVAEGVVAFAAIKVAILLVNSVLALLAMRTKIAAAAQAVLLALQGPAGWAKLAVGIALAAGAVYGVETAFDGVTKKAEAAHKKIEEVSKATPKMTPFQLEQARRQESADKIIDPLREQWRWLGLTGDALVLAKAKQQGLNWEQIKQIETLQRLIQAETDRDEILKAGAATTEANKTALEKYADVIDNLDEQVSIDAITWETYGRAVAKATDELEKASSASKEFKNPEALAEGSAGAINAVLKFQSGRTDPQKRVEELLKRAAEKQQEIANNTDETVRQVAKNRDTIKKAKLF